METVCSSCKNSLISQCENNKITQYCKMCDTCRTKKQLYMLIVLCMINSINL